MYTAFTVVLLLTFEILFLLEDTEDLYTIGFQEVASRYGKKFTFELKRKIMGKQSSEFASTIINELVLPVTVDDFLTETRKIFTELFPLCKVKPGVDKLIRHLHNNDIPMGLATSSTIESYNLKVARHKELFDMIPYKTWGSSDPEVNYGKPSPEVFLITAARFPDSPSPDKCLVFEDSLNGVKAARSAGMQVVMVPDPHLDRSLISDATLVLDSMEEFQPELFGLPPYTD